MAPSIVNIVIQKHGSSSSGTVVGLVIYSKQIGNLVLRLILSVAHEFQDWSNVSKRDLEKENTINVSFFKDKKYYKGDLLFLEKDFDTTLFYTHQPNPIPPVKFYEQSHIPRGMEAYCIGHSVEPYCLNYGYVSHVCEEYHGEFDNKNCQVIMHQIPVYDGDSGGLLFTKNGEVIGFHSHRFQDQHAQYAVSCETVKFLLVKHFKLPKENSNSTLVEILDKIEGKRKLERYFTEPE